MDVSSGNVIRKVSNLQLKDKQPSDLSKENNENGPLSQGTRKYGPSSVSSTNSSQIGRSPSSRYSHQPDQMPQKVAPSHNARGLGGNSAKKLDGYVGFANLPNQVHRRAVRKGFEFTLMVVGESGLGKSTLINSLFMADIYNNKNLVGPSLRPHKTLKVDTNKLLMKEGSVPLTLTLVDTPGFGDQVDNSNCWDPVLEYIDCKYDQHLKAESLIKRQDMSDDRVHCCIYFISPTGHGLKEIDIEFMKRLHQKVNLLPIIAKADTMTVEECSAFKVHVLNDLQAHKINVYQFPDLDDDEDNKINKERKSKVPFAVVGSNTLVDVEGGGKVRGRRYPWGTVEIDNLQHNDFLTLRNMILRSHLNDLKETTHNKHYEVFRQTKLSSVGGGDASNQKLASVPTSGGKNPLAQMEDERQAHREKMRKMEAEMEQVFVQKVREKQKKLKDTGIKQHKELEDLKSSLKSELAELEERKRAFEQERASWSDTNRSMEELITKQSDPSKSMSKKERKLFSLHN